MNNVPQCPEGYNFACSSGGVPTCEFLGFPTCKIGLDYVAGECVPSLITDTFDGLQITSTPHLPALIAGLGLTPDDVAGLIGVSYPGANPSFEIDTSIPFSQLQIGSIDLDDSSGMTFTDVPFEVTGIKGEENKFILTLTLSGHVASGNSLFTIHLRDGSTLDGIIQIIDLLKVDIITIHNPKRFKIGKPKIKRITVHKEGKNLTVGVRGLNFVSRQVYFTQDGVELFMANPDIPAPNTEVTIYPSKLRADLTKKLVTKRSKFLKFNFKLPQNVNEKTEAVLVIATPEGIISARFPIYKKSKTVKLGYKNN